MKATNLSHLTVAQRRAHSKLSPTAWRSAYTLQELLATLNALVRRGLAKRQNADSQFTWPRIGIKYRLAVACDECGSRGPRAMGCDEQCPSCGRSLFCSKEDAIAARRCEARRR